MDFKPFDQYKIYLKLLAEYAAKAGAMSRELAGKSG